MSDIVQKLWGFCHTLRHDGVDYGDYIEQLTYLLFLKMADERGAKVPRDCDWESLKAKSGTALTDHYADILRKLREVGRLLPQILEQVGGGMSGKEPSLFSLFQRSRYICSSSDETDTRTDIRSERERFTTAVVAFCLKHSPTLMQNFWLSICRMKGDLEQAPALSIALEPPHWADLRLSTQTNPRTVWVIEFKLDSDLADKQHPEREQFTRPLTGYGALFRSHENVPSDLRYVVLGSQILPSGSGVIKDLGIRWHARRWHDFNVELLNPDKLTIDLIECLGSLGISVFRMNKIATMQINGPFGEAAHAWEILTALSEWFYQSRRRVCADRPANEHFNMGIYLREPQTLKDGGETLDRLAKQLRSPIETKVWLGYETGPDVGGFARSAWFYCDTHERAEKLLQDLALQFPETVIERDQTACLVVRSTKSHSSGDLDWFRETVNAVELASR